MLGALGHEIWDRAMKNKQPRPGALIYTHEQEKTSHETDIDDRRHAGGVDFPDDR